GGLAVRGRGVLAQAVPAIGQVAGQQRFQIGELAGTPANLDVAVVDDRDAGRVVAAILETPESFDENGEDRPLTDVPDDAAHVLLRSRRQPTDNGGSGGEQQTAGR